MTIIKFDTSIQTELITNVEETNNLIEIKYSDDTFILETCLLSVQKIDTSTAQITIECSFNERSENNKMFLNKILLIEEKLRTFTDKILTSCIIRVDNIYYIKLSVNKDTIFFNKHKKQVSIDNLYINAIIKCLIEINHLELNNDITNYDIKLKQVLIGNSF